MRETYLTAHRPATETLFADLAQPPSGVGLVGMGEVPMQSGRNPSTIGATRVA